MTPEEDDFEGKTYFSRSLSEGGQEIFVFQEHKQTCGFFCYLRSLRIPDREHSAWSGAVSLDIILRLKEVRPADVGRHDNDSFRHDTGLPAIPSLVSRAFWKASIWLA